MRRSNRKPPKYATCDASVGVDYDHKTPRINRCPNKATVELLGASPIGETWVCETCAAKLERNGAHRLPFRKEAPDAEA